MSSAETTRTDFFKDQQVKACDAQKLILKHWTPDTCVPVFDINRTAGCAGHWNYTQPFERISSKQEYFPPIMNATPKHENLKILLDSCE
jgi:hypothetical protein